MLSVQAARMASASSLLFIKRPLPPLYRLRGLADVGCKASSAAASRTSALAVNAQNLDPKTATLRLPKGGGSLVFSAPLSTNAVDDFFDEDDRDPASLADAQPHTPQYREAWMANLGRDDSNAWLTGPRRELDWYTGKAPLAHSCPGTYRRGHRRAAGGVFPVVLTLFCCRRRYSHRLRPLFAATKSEQCNPRGSLAVF
jgi:hypothetical protein